MQVQESSLIYIKAYLCFKVLGHSQNLLSIPYFESNLKVYSIRLDHNHIFFKTFLQQTIRQDHFNDSDYDLGPTDRANNSNILQ